MPPLFNRVIIIGVGLIGSSIGMNLVRKRLAREVVGVGRNPANLREAIRRRAIHRFVRAQQRAPLLENLSEDDLVILAVPVKEIIRHLGLLTRKPLVMDVGSTKRSIVRAATRRKIRFVGSHPIAGTEKKGAAAGEIDLFRERICLLTPTPYCRPGDLVRLRRLWRALGAQVALMEAGRHDRLLAAVSHLPHAAAYSLVQTVSHLASVPEEVRFALGGLKGTTRIAASPPEMWNDIFLENRDFLLRALDRYRRDLGRLRSFIQKRNSRALYRFLREAQKVRLKF